MSRRARARAALRRWVAALGGAIPSGALALAFLAVALMYCGNDNYDKQPDAPRGDGVYRPVLARGDGHMHFLVTRSIVFDRDFHFDNDLKRFGDPWNQPRTITGRKNVMQQIGPSLIWAPFLAAAHGGAVVANALGASVETHGYTMFHQRLVFTSSVLFAWLTIVLGVLLARRLLGGRYAPALAGIGALLGTSLTYYATYMPAYAHAMDAAACTSFLALWAFTLGDLRWRRFSFLGILLGISAMVRAQDIFLGAVVALEIVTLAWRDRSPAGLGRLVLRGGVCLVIAVLLYVPQLYVWNEFYGSWFTTPQGPGQMRYAHPMVMELLFSARNGWLATTPLCYVAMIGLAVGIWRAPRLGEHVRMVCIGMVLAVAGQVYVNAVTYEWWSGASFGQRRLCSVTLAVIVGLAVLLRALHLAAVRRRVRPWFQLALASLGFAWFCAWNLAWVSKLDHAKPAGRDGRTTCCDDVPPPLKWIARPIYRVVGNPFQFPANALFSIQHGVPLARWDEAVGMYPLVPGVLGYEDGSYRRVTAKWDIAGPGGEPYLLDGWSDSQRSDQSATRVWRWTTAPRATLLLPILMPEPHRITLPIAANVAADRTVEVVVRVNGTEAARAPVGPGWSTIVFDTDGSLGTNLIEVQAPIAAPALTVPRGPKPLPNEIPVGVAIGALHVALPPLATMP